MAKFHRILAVIHFSIGNSMVKPQPILSRMPEENVEHEGTWLQWPHHFTYGYQYRIDIEKSWIQMTRALTKSEKVYIIAYNYAEKRRIKKILWRNYIGLGNIVFVIKQTDDAWVRDNGPMFVFDNNNTNKVKVIDWGFNGWGLDAPFQKDNTVPVKVAKQQNVGVVNLNNIVLEGGAIEVDGRGTIMATRSSVLLNKRNPGMIQADMELAMRQNMGITNFIWLDGRSGGKDDITDMHIDGFARFGDTDTIVTMSRANLEYWLLSSSDINTLYSAKDVNGTPYKFLYLPLTKYNVITAYGKNLGYKGSYVNFYVANNVVLMPSYSDPNDDVARKILKQLYPTKSVVKIDVRNLYENGGMVHCVTQQQPKAV